MLKSLTGSRGVLGSVGGRVLKRHLHKLPRLSYSLESGVGDLWSAKTANWLYKDTHGKYLQELNFLVEGTPDEVLSLEQLLIKYMPKDGQDPHSIWKKAAMCYNYRLMWMSIDPAGKDPSPWLLDYLDVHFFGGIFKAMELMRQRTYSFGSGWIWLQDNYGHLEVVSSWNAGNSVGKLGVTPLLAFNMWESAHLVDYHLNKQAYFDTWKSMINWPYVEITLRELEYVELLSPAQIKNLAERKVSINKTITHQ
eukprot:TRINITY_DN1255_c0_g1_i1.p1 TRINITY_DN1255_c0_g1~~TRINITY_DN1255_c0_g1_i1.p1  ORF type:complete len:252 (-),score=27.75 TRINITY_DN1255_c0_g1_i1:19-774(-)